MLILTNLKKDIRRAKLWKRTNICTDRKIMQKTAAAMRGAAAATSTHMSRNIPMSIVMSIPKTGNAPAAADMITTTTTYIPTIILMSIPMTVSAPAAADMSTTTNTDIPTSTPTAMDTTMPQAPPVRSM